MEASSGLVWTLRPLSLLNILISLYKPVRGDFSRAGLFSLTLGSLKFKPSLLLDARNPYVFSHLS